MAASLLRLPALFGACALPKSSARFLPAISRHLSTMACAGRQQGRAPDAMTNSTGASSMLALLGGVRAFRVPAAFRADNSQRSPNARRPGRRAAKLLGKIKAKRLRLRRNKPN